MTYFDSLPDDCAELAADRRKLQQYRAKLARHPNPQDPDFPGPEEYEEEPEPIEALIASVREFCDLAEKHLKANRKENAVLAMHDADFEIAEALGLS